MDHTPEELKTYFEQTLQALMLDTMPKGDAVLDLLDLLAILSLGQSALHSIEKRDPRTAKLLRTMEPFITKRLDALAEGIPQPTGQAALGEVDELYAKVQELMKEEEPEGSEDN